MKKLYLVKDLARATGHSVNTIKFYLTEGLLKEFGRSPYTNFRFFDEESIERLNRIHKLRTDGTSIKKIKEILAREEFWGGG